MANFKKGQTRQWSKGYSGRTHRERYPRFSRFKWHGHFPVWLKRIWSRKARAAHQAAMRGDLENAQFFPLSRVTSEYEWF